MGYMYSCRAERVYPPFMAERGHLARCTMANADLFTSYGDRRGTRVKREALAKAVCVECPLRIECRDWATDTYQQGVWGGTNEIERGFLRSPKGGRFRAAAA